MRRTQTKIASVALKLYLPLALGVAFLAALYIRFYSGLIPVMDRPSWPAYGAYFVISVTLWSAFETRVGLIYRCFEEASLRGWLGALVRLDLLTLAVVSSLAFFWRGYSFSRYTVALFWSFHVLFCFVAAWALRAWLRKGGPASVVYIFVIGDNLTVDSLRRECLPADSEVVARRFSGASEAIQALQSFDPPPDCREILVAARHGTGEFLSCFGEALRRLPVPGAIALGGLALGEIRSTASFVIFSTEPAAAVALDYVFSKRIMDVLLSSAGLILLSPVMVAIAVAIWWRSGRPILFTQERVGRGGRRFLLYKFRTLPLLADGDSRWTSPPAGRWALFLRTTGLDELPQLLNVIKGEMSLVGPRPERPHFVEQFRRQLPFYATRHHLQVGITGWAQVNGLRGDTSIPERVEHDLYYLRHWSLALDFRILWMTVTDFYRRLRGAPHARSV